MVFIVFSRHFSSFCPVGFYDEEKNAQELVKKLKGETFIEEDANVLNSATEPSEFIYTIKLGSEELQFISFDEKVAQSELTKLNGANDDEEEPQPPNYYLEKAAMNKPLLENLQNYGDTVKILNGQPMTFRTDLKLVSSPMPDLIAAKQL
jgi:hypothetical protein